MGLDAVEAEKLHWDERYLRMVRARRRFKAIVRLVIANYNWISQVEETELTDNVQKNIQLITKKKKKAANALELSDIALLNKPVDLRTKNEKKHLDFIINKMNIFQKYPQEVKSQLAEKTYFGFFGPNRTIIRQGRPAEAMYFLLSGEVVVYKTQMDQVLCKITDQEVALLTDGVLFGEVAMLHNIPRTATCETKTDCELLCLNRDDFNIVLRQTVWDLWNHIKRSMARFTYFDNWDSVAIRECCIVTKMNVYSRNEIILGDGYGLPSYTYFVLKGKCRVIEQLFFQFEIKGGKKRYKLYDPQVQTTFDSNKTANVMAKANYESISSVQGSRSRISKRPKTSSLLYSSNGKKTRSRVFSSDTMKNAKGANNYYSSKLGDGSATLQKSLARVLSMHESRESSNINDKGDPDREELFMLSTGELPENVETHFVQVCYYTELACFNIGENVKHRRVLAVDNVECMMIPRYILMQHNSNNVWACVQQFLDLHTPTTELLFRNHFRNIRWKQYRSKLVDDLVKDRKGSAVNSINNVPLSIRIKEILNFE